MKPVKPLPKGVIHRIRWNGFERKVPILIHLTNTMGPHHPFLIYGLEQDEARLINQQDANFFTELLSRCTNGVATTEVKT